MPIVIEGDGVSFWSYRVVRFVRSLTFTFRGMKMMVRAGRRGLVTDGQLAR